MNILFTGLIVLVFLSGIIIPLEISGYSFVGVTDNGVRFPITLQSDDSDDNEDGTSIYDALGVSLAIQNINTDGSIYYGNDITGLQTDIRQYVGVGTNDDWAIAISNDDTVEAFNLS